jgi:hypothetical protein
MADATEPDEQLKNIPLPEGAITKITKEPDNKWRNRWSYRMAKREFRKERKHYLNAQVYNAINAADSDPKVKAIRKHNRNQLIWNVTKLGFLFLFVVFAPNYVPQIIDYIKGSLF